MLDALTPLLEAGAAAPWVLAVVLLVAVGDALLPPMPSEGVVVALAAVAVAGDGPHLPLLALAAGVGAFLGDSLTFVVGRRFGPQRLAPGRPAAAASRARAARPAPSSAAARWSCSPRATCRSAGSPSTSPPVPPASHRVASLGLAALAAATWAAWSVGRRRPGRHWLRRQPAARVGRRHRARPRPGARRRPGRPPGHRLGPASPAARHPTSTTRRRGGRPVASPVLRSRAARLTTPSRGCPPGARPFALSTRECQ